MVFMSVGDHEALYLVHIFLQVRDIRDHHIDSQHIVVGERKTAVHHNNTVLVLEGSNVQSNLLQPAQRYYFQLGAAIIHLFCFFQSNYLHIPYSTRRASPHDR